MINVFISHSCFSLLFGDLLTNFEGFVDTSWTLWGQKLLACVRLHAVWEIAVKAGFRILALNTACMSQCFAVTDDSSHSVNMKELYIRISAIKQWQ